MLKKYLWSAAFLVFLSVLVTAHHQKNSYDSASVNANRKQPPIPSNETPNAQAHRKYAEWYAPGWNVAYLIFEWPNGITVWALFLTMSVIAEQTYQTRMAASATEKAAVATEKAVEVARRQADMIRDKDRARIEIKPGTLSLDEPLTWGLKGDVRIRNLGTSRAYINRFPIEIVWHKRDFEPPTPNLAAKIDILQESFVDPTKETDDPTDAHGWLWGTEETNLGWFATSVYGGVVTVLLRGIFEYGTVGVTYRRYFVFEWVPTKYDGLFATLYNQTPAATNSQKISFGYWKTLMNSEHEIPYTEPTEDDN